MMPKQGTLPHTRNSNESKRRRRHRIGAGSIKRRGCRHQNQAARRRRRRRACPGCLNGERRRRRRLREYFKVVMLPEVNSCTMRPQLSPLVRRMRATTTCLAYSKSKLSPPQFFFSLPPEIYIQSTPNNLVSFSVCTIGTPLKQYVKDQRKIKEYQSHTSKVV